VSTPILVTGGAGFIGSHLVDALLEAGESVVVFDDFNDFYSPRQKRDNLDAAWAHRRFRLITGDIRDGTALEDAVRTHHVRRVVHLAARAGVQPSLRDPVLYADVNVTGTAAVLQVCARSRVEQVIFASSSSVYGVTAAVPFTEQDAADRPISPYATSKRAGELQCWTFHHLTAIPVTCLRFFTAYGPRNRPDMAVYRFAQAIRDGRDVVLFGHGTRRDLTFVGDVVGGILGALEHPQPFLTCNLGRGQPVAVADVIQELTRLLKRPAVLRQAPLPPGDVPVTWADIRVAREAIGYRPSVELAEGLERFVRWFADIGLEAMVAG